LPAPEPVARQRQVVVVTGASGTCGREVLARLASQRDRYEVHTVGRQPLAFDGHILHELGKPLPADVLPSRLDAVVHCAALVDERAVGYAIIDANMRMSYNVAQYALAAAAGVFVNLSSIAVYGHQAGESVIDESTPLAPATVYGLSKALCETLCATTIGVAARCTSLRLGYVLGRGMQERTVVSRFAASLAAGKPLRLVNPDETRFPFVDARDVAAVVESLLSTPVPGVFNVVGDAEPTVREVAQELRRFFPCSPEVSEESVDPAKVSAPRIDNRRIKDALGVRFTPVASSLAYAIADIETTVP